jgi:hypothetical protein
VQKCSTVFVLLFLYGTAESNCDSYQYASNQLVYTSISSEESVLLTCSLDVDVDVDVDVDQVDDVLEATLEATLQAKKELSRFLMGRNLIKDLLKSDAITKLKVDCSGFKSNQLVDVTLKKVTKIDSCVDDKRVMVTIKKIL